jgi:hypothetical protein
VKETDMSTTMSTKWKMRIVKGDWMRDGFVSDIGPKTFAVEVSSTGELRDPEWGTPLTAERWGDGEYITNGCWTFAPDAGELDRIKCRITLCGSACSRLRKNLRNLRNSACQTL